MIIMLFGLPYSSNNMWKTKIKAKVYALEAQKVAYEKAIAKFRAVLFQ
jgi:hypothetical protein